MSVAPPPGLAGPSPTEIALEVDVYESFVKANREKPLPKLLVGDPKRLERFESTVLSSIEGLYRDRMPTTLGEVQRRIRGCGWTSLTELAAIVPLCAQRPEIYKLTAPSHGEPPRILLKGTTPWFTGFVDMENGLDNYSVEVWESLEFTLAQPGVCPLKGGVAQAANQLYSRYGLPMCLRSLTLGEWRHLLHLALGARDILRYSENNGDLIESKRGPGQVASPERPAKAAETAVDTEAERLTQALASQRLPSNWKGMDLTSKRQCLRGCIESLYYDRIRPTLREIQQRLEKSFSWSSTEARAAAMLCAREPEVYVVVPPSDGKPAHILLRSPPRCFQGFLAPTSGETTDGDQNRQPQKPPPAVLTENTWVNHLTNQSDQALKNLAYQAVRVHGMTSFAGGNILGKKAEKQQAMGQQGSLGHIDAVAKKADKGRIYSEI